MSTPIWSAADLQFVSRMGIAAFDACAEQEQQAAYQRDALQAFYRRQRKTSWPRVGFFACFGALIVGFWVAFAATVTWFLSLL